MLPSVARAAIRDSATKRVRASICANCIRVKMPTATMARSAKAIRKIRRRAMVMVASQRSVLRRSLHSGRNVVGELKYTIQARDCENLANVRLKSGEFEL